MSTAKKRWLIAAAVFIAMAIVFGAAYLFSEKAAEGQAPEYSPAPTPTAAASEAAAPEVPIDFSYWQGLNPDVYGWITIPNTRIDYQILHSETDNAYYLEHNLDGSAGLPGCIYSENYNHTDFADPVTILYGHNMKETAAQTMFRDLHKFESAEFFEANREILIYQPNRILHYKVFSVYNNSDEHLMYAFDFSTEEGMQAFLEQCEKPRDMNAKVDADQEVSVSDKLLVLSTCTNVDTERLLVVAVLDKVEE